MLHERQFLFAFYGGGGRFPKWLVSFLVGYPLFRRGDKRQLCLQLVNAVRNGGLGKEGIDTGMMMQLVDCTIDTP